MPTYCYDTEFLEDGSTIELISIGIVCEDGREYYAVNADMDHDRIKADDWLCQNVIKHLPGCADIRRYTSGTGWLYSLDLTSTLVKPKWVIANEVREFLLASVVPAMPSGMDDIDDEPAYGFPELWAYYAAYDHVALAQLWGKMINLPKGIPMWTHDLMQLVDGIPGFKTPGQDGNEHNALADARWNLRVLTAAREAVS